jgi:hypothetical protein
MKLNLLFLSALFVTLSINAQYTLEDANGDAVLDGDILTYGTLTYPEASFDFFVNNVSATETIRMRIEFVSAENADGSDMELCFGECYTGIAVGLSYPTDPLSVEILPGEQTMAGNHLFNSDPGNGSDVILYTFRYFQIDMAGNEIGDPLTVIYRYDPLLGVNSNELNVNLFSTVIKDELVLNVEEELDLMVYDLQGRVVKSQRLEIGTQQINMSDLSPQMYLMHFQNNRGVSYTAKVIVK